MYKHERRYRRKEGQGSRIWEEFIQQSNKRRRLSEAELRRLVDMHQVITTERMMALLAAVTAVIKENVHERHALAAISRGLGELLPLAQKVL